MRYLLDTNTCIDFMRGAYQSLANKFNSMDDNSLVLCSIVYSELIFGAFNTKILEKNLSAVRAFSSRFEIIPYNLMLRNIMEGSVFSLKNKAIRLVQMIY